MNWRWLLTPPWAREAIRTLELEVDHFKLEEDAARRAQRQATRAYANYRKGNAKTGKLMDTLADLTGAITARNLPSPEKLLVHPLVRDAGKIDLTEDHPRAGGYTDLKLYGIEVESYPALPDGYVVLKPGGEE